MVATIRDWQLAGITIKVEVATSGALVVGKNQTDIPFNTGGTNGAPYGWSPGEYSSSGNAGNTSKYNFTTQQGTFSVSVVTPGDGKYAGIWGPVYTAVPGYRYQIGVQARQMASKDQSSRDVVLETSSNGGNTWSIYTGSQGVIATSDWEDILATGNAMPAGMTMMRPRLIGGPNLNNAAYWGTQFQNLYIRQLDLAPPALTWRDISCDVMGLGIRYGRERFTNRYDVSTLVVDLLNDDGEYTYHSNHPFGLQPGRQVRVTAQYKGVTYPLAFHVIDTLNEGYTIDGHSLSHWNCVDPTTVLSNVTVATNSGPVAYPSGTRINMLLDQVGYIPRLIDTGKWNTQKVTGSNRTIRDECGVTADSEGGNFFADRSGNCVYKDRSWLTTDPNLTQVTADLLAMPAGDLPYVDDIPNQPNSAVICTDELNTDWSLDRVINVVSLANAGGVARNYSDPNSVKTYGPQTYQRMDFVLWSDSDLDTRANDIMSGYSDPVLRVNSVGFAPGISQEWEWTLGVFLNWLVRVWYEHPINGWGFAVCVHVQSIEHRISPSDWSTTMSVDLPQQFAELEFNDYGWDMGNWDEAIWDQMQVAGALWNNAQNWNDPNTSWGDN